jgi:hypothetical protein
MSEILLPEQQRAIDYLAKKGTNAPADKLRQQLADAFAAVERAFDDVPDEKRESAPAAGKWSPHEILDHLVLSHGPAIEQFASLLEGVSPGGIAIPADLHRDERPVWSELRTQLGEIHRQFMRLMESATDDVPLEAKAVIEIVVKVDSKPTHWFERIDWKAFIQGIRVHAVEHQKQLERTIETLKPL